MNADYCPDCGGDPRRRANVERHKTHGRTVAEMLPYQDPAAWRTWSGGPANLQNLPREALPADSKEDWLELPD